MKRKLIFFGAIYWILCLLVSIWAFPSFAQDNAKIGAGRAGVFSAWHIFGFNADVAQAAEETVWDHGGAYSYLSTPTTITVSSSDADDADADTGARTVRLWYLDGSSGEIIEELTLSGQTEVTAAFSASRVNAIEVLTAGSSGSNEGSIYVGSGTVTAGVPANVFARILAGNNRALSAIYTVPAGKRAMLENLTVVTALTSTEAVAIRVLARATGGVLKVVKQFSATSAGGAVTIPGTIPILFGAETDIEVRALSSGAARDVAVDGTLIIVN